MRGRHGLRGLTAVGVAITILAGACTGGSGDESRARSRRTAPESAAFAIRLSAGRAAAAAAEQIEVVAGEELPAAEVAAVVRRLPPFEAEGGDRSPFRRPTEPRPRPQVGATAEQPFGVAQPPAGAAPAGAGDGRLEVLRHQPDGEVTVAPFISVTFDEPMVPVSTLDQLEDEDVPVRVTPDVPGRWRWIGTRTLRFDAASEDVDRLPMATEFAVEVPAGTRAPGGATLAEAVRWSFRTPPPHVSSFGPTGDAIAPDPVFVAVFDQRVDPEAVLPTITLQAGDDERPIRLATAEEIAADDDARQRTEEALEGRWVAFRPDDLLPAGQQVRVEIGPGTPSAEGPRTTDEPSRHEARTHGALRVRERRCGYGEGCRPESPFTIRFSNPLDPASFDPDQIRISPELLATVGASGDTITIHGPTTAGTDYSVTVPGSLRDVFGQALGDDDTVEFEVGDASPALVRPEEAVVTADPMAGDPTFAVSSVGHESLHVEIRRVAPAEFPEYQAFLRNWDGEDLDDLPDWPVTSSEVLEIEGDRNVRTESTIRLAEAVGGERGHVVVTVAPTARFERDTEEYWSNRPVLAWVQVTSLGVDAVIDRDELVAWVTDLGDGAPVAGAEVQLDGRGGGASTAADGLVTLPLRQADHLLATVGDDTAILPAQYGGEWTPSPAQDTLRWHVLDDRGVYRPGEQARVKGWVRRLELRGDAGIAPVGPGSVTYVLRDAFGAELARGTAPLSDTGGFDLSLDVPADAAVGPASVELALVGEPQGEGSTAFHQFQVLEFRRPTFEVATRAESPAPHVMTGPVTLAAVATYFAGGVLADAPLTWRVRNQPTTYAPPNWPGFTFGKWRPWWIEGDAVATRGRGFAEGDEALDPIDPCCGEEVEEETYTGRTDGSGAHYLQLDFGGDKPDEPITVSANAAAEDVDRQSFASTVDVLVHPASLYVGLRGVRTFVRAGEDLEVEAIVTDLVGEAIEGRELQITMSRLEPRVVAGEWDEVEVDRRTCDVVSAAEPVSCSFEPDRGGEYRIASTVTDGDGGRNRTELTRWVSGATAIPDRTVDEEVVTIVPDKEQYQVGETAELLVVAPFEQGHGRLTLSRNGIESSSTFDLAQGSAVVEVALTEALVPGVEVLVDVAGTAPRRRDDGTVDPELPPRPAFASGRLTLPVPPKAAVLDVTAQPRAATLEPGARTTIDLAVKDAAGRGVGGAEVAVVVVDEAVLSLTGYELGDPVASFFAPFVDQLQVEHLRRTLRLSRNELLASGPAAPTSTVAGTSGGADTAEGDDAASGAGATADLSAQRKVNPLSPAAAEAIRVRSDFAALALFAPAVRTGPDGTAAVDLEVPDTLTRYRVMAVAADAGDRFGSAESSITARLPLMVRASAPRFLNFGDRFELPVVVQNQTDGNLSVDVVVEATNLLLGGTGGRRVDVPAGGRAEVRFPAEADDAGTARYRVAAVSGDLTDASTGSLPVYTPVTSESFATYGVIDDGAVAQPLRTPAGVVPQFGGLEIETSSTAVQALTDAVVYLAEYDYGSADAYASRIIALTSLRDVFAAFAAEGRPTPDQLDQRIRADITELVALQGEDGGFGTWRPGGPSQPYETVQATHALVVAGAAGYPVPAESRRRALAATADIEELVPAEWDVPARRTVQAYALHVRAVAGDRAPAEALTLHRSGELPLDAVAWLWPVIDDPAADSEIARLLADRATETAGAATFTTGHDEGAHLVLASDRRTDAIVLDALLTEQPASDLVPKVVAGLLGNQVAGRWANVQENGFVLLAMKRYFDTFEAQDPDFVARTWLGDTYAAEHPHRGRSIERQRTLVPMAELGGDPQVVIGKEGAGRLYYRLGLRYAPADLAVAARDEGFVVDRTYEGADDAGAVDRAADGTWRIEPGATVRVRVTMVAESARTNMALVDPLPAGLEMVDAALANAPRTPPAEVEGNDGEDVPLRFWGTWWDHQEARDDRAAAFSAYLPAGTYEYTYVARATTPGTFVVPPARAEEIYAPETFGRSASTTVVIGD